jgi:hypothetical protein
LRAAARGIVFDHAENAFGVDYGWILKRSRDDVKETTEKLSQTAQKAGYRKERNVVGLIASFVQTLNYEEQDSYRESADGTVKYIGGVSMPLETLANGLGDCDTKCLLYGSLLSHIKGAKMVLIRRGNHVFVGVQSVPMPRDRYIRLRNENYVLIELTSPWILGHIPGENWHSLQTKKFGAIPLTGN